MPKIQLIELPTQTLLLEMLLSLPKIPTRRIISFAYDGIEYQSPRYKEVCEKSNVSGGSKLVLTYDNTLGDFKISDLQQPPKDYRTKKVHIIDVMFNRREGFNLMRNNYLADWLKDGYQVDYLMLEAFNPKNPEYKIKINLDKTKGLEIISDDGYDAEKMAAWFDNLKKNTLKNFLAADAPKLPGNFKI